MIKTEHKNFLFFILECLVGTVIGFMVYHYYPVIGAWCLFSIVLVLAPEKKDAVTIAINRIKANVIGALAGLTLCYFHPVTLPMICAGIAVAMLICEWLKLSSVTRSAIVALLIITMHEPGSSFWAIAIERAGGVMLGCLIGVAITYAFHIARTQSSRTLHKLTGKQDQLNEK